MVFPYALVGLIVPDKDEKGLQMGVMNVFICVPQLMNTLYTGALAEASSWRMVALVGGIFALLGAVSCYYLIGTPTKDHRFQKLETNNDDEEDDFALELEVMNDGSQLATND